MVTRRKVSFPAALAAGVLVDGVVVCYLLCFRRDLLCNIRFAGWGFGYPYYGGYYSGYGYPYYGYPYYTYPPVYTV